jgi:alpha-L-fucosidase 2
VTGDREFLRTAPALAAETAAFYLDFVEVRDGVAHFSPSISPENAPAGKPNTVADATMDVVICREALSNLLEALRVLEEPMNRKNDYRQLLAALPPYRNQCGGGLREWLHPDLADVQTHVHMSHLYGLFPGWEISPKTHRKFTPGPCALWNCVRTSWAAWPGGVSPSWLTSGPVLAKVTKH